MPTPDAPPPPLLQVTDLSVHFRATPAPGEAPTEVQAVREVSFHLHAGETVGIVGESGSGKSVSALSILRLLPYPTAYHPSGAIRFGGCNLLRVSERRLRELRGGRIGMIAPETNDP